MLRPALLALLGAVLWLRPASGLAADLPPLHFIAAHFPPYTLLDQDRAAGPTAALIAALAGRLGQPGRLDVQPFARALATAENEPDTLVALIARTPEREARFQWVCAVLDYDVAMFRLRMRADVTAAGIEDLKRWRIAGMRHDVKTAYLERRGIPVIETADEDEAVRLLLFGRVDAMASHPATLRMRLRDAGLGAGMVTELLPLPEVATRLYLAFGNRTKPAVVQRTAEACEAMLQDGTVTRLLTPTMVN